jgi:hypothetical protein
VMASSSPPANFATQSNFVILASMRPYSRNTPIFRPLAAWLPIAMSFAALALVAFHIATAGTAPQADEGTAAHLWQLLMVGQTPLLIFYAIKRLPRTPRSALLVMGVQIGAAMAAFAPVYLLHW